MAMLYLTPVLPLGLVSYMCGTTAMHLHSFVVAKIASLPLYLMYTFMGASAHSFIKGGKGGKNNLGKSLAEEANKLEENQYLILSGLILSAVMIGLITRKIKKELMKVRSSHTKIIVGRNRPTKKYTSDITTSLYLLGCACDSIILPFASLAILQILDEQKKEKIDESSNPLIDSEESDEKTIELGLTARRKTSTKAPQK